MSHPIPSRYGIYLPTFTIKINHSCTKTNYTSPMDGMGIVMDLFPVAFIWAPSGPTVGVGLLRREAWKKNGANGADGGDEAL